MRAFYLVAANSLASVVASMLVWFSTTIWAYLQTRSVVITSILSAAYLTGLILTSIVFGSIVDHHKKRLVMIASDIASGLFYVLGFVLYVTASPETLRDPSSVHLWLLLAAVFAGVIVANLRAIALPTLTAILVPEDKRDKANGFTGTINGLAFLICPMLGGFLIAASGLLWVLLIAIALRLLTVAHLAMTSIPGDVVASHAHPEAKPKIDLRGTFKVILGVPGLMALMLFNSLNNFLGGVFMPLMDPYGLSFVNQQTWGVISGVLSIGFILGALFIAKFGLGKNPLRRMMLTNVFLWTVCVFMAIQPSLVLLVLGILCYFIAMPAIEAGEQTIIQKVVPKERQGRVFGFAQTIESAASPVSSIAVGPLTQFVLIPFMTVGAGTELIGGWFGTGEARGIALAFVGAGLVGLFWTLLGLASKYYRLLSDRYMATPAEEPAPTVAS
jgi:DHA3 family multidrug efflux protein-like MFS transporter